MVPIFLFSKTYGLCKSDDKIEELKDSTFRCLLAATLCDAALSISAFVVGILGLLSVIAMPPAAGYALVGVSAVITVLWIALIVALVHDSCGISSEKGWFPYPI